MLDERATWVVSKLRTHWLPALVIASVVTLGILIWGMVAGLSVVVDGLVALGTLVLAGVTVGLIVDARTGRREERRDREAATLEERRERDAAHFRAALIEQIENCRHWYSHNPTGGAPAVVFLRNWEPSFGELTHLLGSVDMPGELTAYLVWLTADTRFRNGLLQNEFRVLAPDIPRVQDIWNVELDRLQAVASLLHAETERRKLEDVANAFDPTARWLPWLKPRIRPSEFVVTAELSDETYFGAPPWPSDPAYKKCSVAERNHVATELWEQSKAEVKSRMQLH